MFKKANEINEAFRYIRLFSLVFLTGCILISCFALIKSYRLIEKAQERVYILAGGKALEAFAADRKENIPVEARDHVQQFHRDFFTLDPDEKVIHANISRALYLADVSAKKQYDNLRENGYYTSLVAGNISQQIEIDSVDVETTRYPYFFRCLAHEKLIRTTSILSRNLITEGYLRNVSRSDNNPHGFLIEHWVIIENKDLKTENR